MRTVNLATPPLPRLVPAETFDAFSWCASDVLEWRCPGDAITLNALDDALARREWGWQPEYDVEEMSTSLVAELRLLG